MHEQQRQQAEEAAQARLEAAQAQIQELQSEAVQAQETAHQATTKAQLVQEELEALRAQGLQDQSLQVTLDTLKAELAVSEEKARAASEALEGAQQQRQQAL